VDLLSQPLNIGLQSLVFFLQRLSAVLGKQLGADGGNKIAATTFRELDELLKRFINIHHRSILSKPVHFTITSSPSFCIGGMDSKSRQLQSASRCLQLAHLPPLGYVFG
jgi:hypothetical protein